MPKCVLKINNLICIQNILQCGPKNAIVSMSEVVFHLIPYHSVSGKNT
jgi:hypothetical protein